MLSMRVNTKGVSPGEFALLVAGMFMAYALVASAFGIPAGFGLKYAMNHWLAYYHRPATFPFWPGFFACWFPGRLGQTALVLIVLGVVTTFIASFFLG